MALTQNQQDAVWADAMQQMSAAREITTLLKSDLAAAVAAIDAWIESNQTSFNNALPTAAKNNLTSAQKLRLFYMVASKRYTG